MGGQLGTSGEPPNSFNDPSRASSASPTLVKRTPKSTPAKSSKSSAPSDERNVNDVFPMSSLPMPTVPNRIPDVERAHAVHVDAAAQVRHCVVAREAARDVRAGHGQTGQNARVHRVEEQAAQVGDLIAFVDEIEPQRLIHLFGKRDPQADG